MVVSIAINSMDRPQELRRLVQRLVSMQGDFEIVVIEHLSAGVEDHGPIPGVVYRRLDVATGFGAMRQLTVEHASGDVIVFLDDDCLPCASWLEALLPPFDDPVVSAVGGGFIPQTGGVVAMATALLGLPGGGFPRLCRLNGQAEITRDLSNGNLALRKSAVAEIGGYRGDLASGGEDSDLIARLPGRTVFVPSALVAHRNRDDWLAIWHWFYRRGHAAADFFHGSRSHAYLFNWRKSALLKLGLIAAAIGVLPGTLSMVLVASYYGFNVFRVSRSNRAMLGHTDAEAMRRAATRLPPLLVAPLLRLWMDSAYEIAFRLRRLSHAAQ